MAKALEAEKDKIIKNVETDVDTLIEDVEKDVYASQAHLSRASCPNRLPYGVMSRSNERLQHVERLVASSQAIHKKVAKHQLERLDVSLQS